MPKGDAIIIGVNPREANLKRKLREHLHSLGFTKTDEGALRAPGNTKDAIRTLHSAQREERLLASEKFVLRAGGKLMQFFASGKDVNPEKISPVLERDNVVVDPKLSKTEREIHQLAVAHKVDFHPEAEKYLYFRIMPTKVGS